MPREFPDMKSLERVAAAWKFRERLEDETEAQYRTTLADYVQPKDLVESMEIRTGKGWNRFNEQDQSDLLLRERFIASRK